MKNYLKRFLGSNIEVLNQEFIMSKIIANGFLFVLGLAIYTMIMFSVLFGDFNSRVAQSLIAGATSVGFLFGFAYIIKAYLDYRQLKQTWAVNKYILRSIFAINLSAFIYLLVGSYINVNVTLTPTLTLVHLIEAIFLMSMIFRMGCSLKAFIRLTRKNKDLSQIKTV